MIGVTVASLVVLVVLLTFGVPLPFCFGGSLMIMNIFGGVTMKGMMMWGFNQLSNPVLLCIPLFVFAGSLMSESGIAKSLLHFVNVFVGRIRGGLGVVASVSCAIIGAISGSGLTGVAATGPILIPQMEKMGYPRGYAAALVTNSSIFRVIDPSKRHHDRIRLGDGNIHFGVFSGNSRTRVAYNRPLRRREHDMGKAFSLEVGT